MKFGMIFSKKDRLCKKNAYILRRDVDIYIIYIYNAYKVILSPKNYALYILALKLHIDFIYTF